MDLDAEIEELERLIQLKYETIRLQQQKLDLLRRKNTAGDSIPAANKASSQDGQRRSVDSDLDIDEDTAAGGALVIKSPLRTTSDSSYSSSANSKGKPSIEMKKGQQDNRGGKEGTGREGSKHQKEEEEEEEEEEENDLYDRSTFLGRVGSFFNYSSAPKVKNRSAADVMEDVSRLNSLSSNLANDRTLMAYIRTALAVARTMVAFYALEGVTGYGEFISTWSPVAYAVLACLVLAIGGARFNRMKYLIYYKKTMQYTFLTNNWTVVITCMVLLLLGAIASCASSWTKA
jgi:uncharacterized membrane protein YidH (DUF202 family)